MKNFISLSILIIGFSILLGCTSDNNHPFGGDGIAPGKIKLISIKNLAGGSVIYFTPPTDQNLLYVSAVYNDDKGRKKEVKVSRTIDSLVINGFGKGGAYNVAVNAYNTGGDKSETTNIDINPLDSDIVAIANSLTGEVDFGGIRIYFLNPSKSKVSINIFINDPLKNELTFRESYFTSMSSGSYAFRGYDGVPTKFGVNIEDLYGNVTETKYFEITPLWDEYVKKERWSIIPLYGDKNYSQYGFNETQIWDGRWSDQWNCGHSDFQTKLPHHLTLDLGTVVKLNRFKLYQRGGYELYRHGNPKHFKIYGIEDMKSLANPVDMTKGWVLLKDCYSIKPSGLPLGQATAEDYSYQDKGEDFEFDRNNLVKARYIRIVVLENWGSMDVTVIGELSFWGEISK